MLNILTAAASTQAIGKRFRVPEIMDQPGLARDAHELALRGISRINALSFTASHLWRQLQRIARANRLSRLRVLDVGCGNADVTIGIARRARRAGFNVEMFGCDRTKVAVDAAQELARRETLEQIRFFQADVLADDLRGEYGAVVSSLFLHHLNELDAVKLLRRLRGVARRAIVMDDLCRSSLGYWLARWGCRLLSRSPVVHFDGPASVESALTAGEALALAREAGLDGAIVARRWPERFTLIWENGIHANQRSER